MSGNASSNGSTGEETKLTGTISPDGNLANDPNLTVIDSRAVNFLLMKLRNKATSQKDFMVYGDRVMRILAEEALCRVPSVKVGNVQTPCGVATGLVDEEEPSRICLVSVVRSGDILQEAVRQIQPGVKVGKILIQRDESTEDKRPMLYYKKLPADIDSRFVLLVDPMLATAGSAKMAVSVLVESGVQPKNIMFVNLISCPEGLMAMKEEYPETKIITCAVDELLDERRFIVPGLGDYGDRYYGTE